MMTVTAKAG